MRVAWKVTTRNRRSVSIRNQRLYLKYRKGEVITAPEDSIGIFCFRSKYFAERFVARMDPENEDRLKILKVALIGKANRPIAVCNLERREYMNQFCRWVKQNGRNPYKLLKVITDARCGLQLGIRMISVNIPPGTVCAPAVKVLE